MYRPFFLFFALVMTSHTGSLQANDLVFSSLFNKPFSISIADFQIQLVEQDGQPVLIMDAQAMDAQAMDAQAMDAQAMEAEATSEEATLFEGSCNQPACMEVSLLREIRTLTQSNGICNLQMTLTPTSRQSFSAGYRDRHDPGTTYSYQKPDYYMNSLSLILSFSLYGTPVEIPLRFQHQRTRGGLSWLWGIDFFNSLYSHTSQDYRYFNPLSVQVLQVVIEALKAAVKNNFLLRELPHPQGTSVACNPKNINPLFLDLHQPIDIKKGTLVKVPHSSSLISTFTASTFTAGSITYTVSLSNTGFFPLIIEGIVPPVTINNRRPIPVAVIVRATVLVLILGSFLKFFSWM